MFGAYQEVARLEIVNQKFLMLLAGKPALDSIQSVDARVAPLDDH